MDDKYPENFQELLILQAKKIRMIIQETGKISKKFKELEDKFFEINLKVYLEENLIKLKNESKNKEERFFDELMAKLQEYTIREKEDIKPFYENFKSIIRILEIVDEKITLCQSYKAKLNFEANEENKEKIQKKKIL